MSYEIRLLGSWRFRTSQGDVPVPAGQLRVLLTSLALSANQPVPTHSLVEQLWPERPPIRAVGTVHMYVSRLRRLLGPGLIHTQPRGGGYQLAIPVDAVDVHRFRHLLWQAARVDSVDEELALLRSALGLWRGAPFADLYSTWLDREVVPRLTEEWVAATSRRIGIELAAGQPEPFIAELRDLTSRYPVRESLWELLITALHRAGRRAEALDTYQRVRTTLRDELGIEPREQLVQVHREILLDGGDTAGSLRQLPHDIARFTGRSAELARLDELLAQDEPAGREPVPTIIAIDGAPGVGKTTLAVHWAHQVARRYPDAQLYVNLRGYGPGDPVPPEAAAERMLRALGIRRELIPSDLDERSALLRSTLSGYDALILLDNARNSEQVRALLPGGRGLVVVTSRAQLRELSIQDGARRVTLDPLPRQQSVDLLAAAVGNRWVAEDPTATATIVELCDRLPLALAIVAERAQRAGSLAAVMTELANEHARLDQLDTGGGSSLRATLSWSYRALDTDAAAMFGRLGLLPASDIELRTAAALADVPVAHARITLDQLVSTHLVEQQRPDRYELHDLIRLYASEIAEREDVADRAAAIRRVLDWYLHTAVSADQMLMPHRCRRFLVPYKPITEPPEFSSAQQARTWFQQEYECLRSVVAWAFDNGFAGHAWRIALAMGTFFGYMIPWRDNMDFYTSVLVAAEKSGEVVGQAYLFNMVGCIHHGNDDRVTAQSYLERSLASFQSVSHSRGEAMAMANLGLVHGELGDTDTALSCGTQAIHLFGQIDNRRGTALSLDNIGTAHLTAGQYPQAVEHFQQALEIFHQLGDLEFEAITQHHLAHAHTKLRHFSRSTRAYRQAISLYRTAGNRRAEAVALADFAATLTEAGHPTIARSLWQTALPTLTEFAHPRSQEIEAILDATQSTELRGTSPPGQGSG